MLLLQSRNLLRTLVLVSFLSTALTSFANDGYEKAWEALSRNDRKAALTHLQTAKKDPQTALNAYLTEIFLQDFEGKTGKIPGLQESIEALGKDRNAYVYALWFKNAMLGDYGKKTEEHQLQMIKKIISDPAYNGSLQAAAHYVYAMHFLMGRQRDKARNEWDAMGAVQAWQLVGPFENISGTGSRRDFGPLAQPAAGAKFKGLNDIEVSWFTPARMNNEGWVTTYGHIQENTAVVYAQAFVNAPEDMQALLNTGTNCAIKIWVNDVPVIAENRERTTELDYYKNPCNLKKGYNRILVQLSYTDNTHPNFILRLTDPGYNAIKGITATSAVQSYTKGSGSAAAPASMQHFAEAYFLDKIAQNPQSLINYLLLSQAYLRSDKINEAREILEKALAISPDNSLIRYELIQCLLKSENRTLLLQEVERLKEKDPNCYLTRQIRIKQLINEEKYTEAEDLLKQITEDFGSDQNSEELRITLLGKLERFEEFFKAIEAAYKKYPDNATFVQTMFQLQKEAYKKAKDALNIYERYLKNNYNFQLINQLANEYSEQGMDDQYLGILKMLREENAYDPTFSTNLCRYYFVKQDYRKALEYAEEALKLAPYESAYWSNLAAIHEQMNHKQEAIQHYKTAINLNRTNYDAYKKLVALEKKTDATRLVPQTDVYALIAKAPATSDYNFAYLLDEKSTLIYDKGASEEYVTYAVKLYNAKGIENWKEIYLPSGSGQSLMVEKCEVIKTNGNKVQAERDDNQVVFTNLEVGDVIHVKYRIQNYFRGRMGREYWDKYVFNAFVPSGIGRYTLITPSGFNFRHEILNGKVSPVVKTEGDYKVYTWEMKDMEPIKSEPLMPNLNDVGVVLHLSTIGSWKEVADWYSDLAYQDLTNNFDLENFYREIFPKQENLSELEKARRIYNYIVTNIQYSSIPFRQSGLVPQAVSKIINTRLGDCKDVSSLFVALARKAGITAHLVLVDTRDNGAKDIVLPSVEFNHCIVLAKINNKDYYIELTDSELPFGSLPRTLSGALSLQIPAPGEENKESGLKALQPANSTRDQYLKDIKITFVDKDMKLDVVNKKTGSLTSSWRQNFANLSATELHKDFEQSISGGYKNPVKLNSVTFYGLKDLVDTVRAEYSYTVKNEVIEAGSMRMIKVPLLDVVASIDNFSLDKRDFPIEYWNYEDADVYESNIEIQLPAGQNFLEIPANQSFSFRNASYKITYVKNGTKLKINRYAKLDRENILPADYEAFKKFFNQIVEAEAKYIVFK